MLTSIFSWLDILIVLFGVNLLYIWHEVYKFLRSLYDLVKLLLNFVFGIINPFIVFHYKIIMPLVPCSTTEISPFWASLFSSDFGFLNQNDIVSLKFLCVLEYLTYHILSTEMYTYSWWKNCKLNGFYTMIYFTISYLYFNFIRAKYSIIIFKIWALILKGDSHFQLFFIIA